MRWQIVALCGWLAISGVADGAEPAGKDLGFKVPPGFEVTLFADDDLAHDIFSMTIDSSGRVVVAGPKYVKILHDDNADGRADRATLFSEIPASGAHGMVFDGPDLVCTGDNSLMKLRDQNGDGQADGPPEKLTALRHPEHGANGVVKGPDGWYYVICGNDAGVTEKHATTPFSPVKKPNCGAVVRVSPDGKQSEIFAHGFRNPYDLDFNAQGHLFTVDADGERDQYLPWYAPTRLFDVAQGMHHGWLIAGWTRSWNRPAYFFDNVPRLVELGRGSPTGLVVYRHRQFPEKYRGGVLSACWTLGRIYHCPLTPHGASYQSQREVFMETTGQVGFAPTDLAVGPDGDLFVSIGGRGTRGSVFRVRYKEGHPVPPIPGGALQQVTSADQPLASWSRARWLPLAKEAKLAPSAWTDAKLTDAERIRAIEAYVETQPGGLKWNDVEPVLASVSPPVQARLVWGTQPYTRPRPRESFTWTDDLVKLLQHGNPPRDRALWELLANRDWKPACELPSPPRRPGGIDAVDAGLTSSDVYVRNAAMQAVLLQPMHQSLDPKLQADVVAGSIQSGDEAELRRMLGQAKVLVQTDHQLHEPLLKLCRRCLAERSKPDLQLDALRVAQLVLGDVRTAQAQAELYTGYAPRELRLNAKSQAELLAAVRYCFDAKSPEVVAEAARLAGMLEVVDPELPLAIALCLTAEQSPQSDLHQLIVLSRVAGERTAATTRLSSLALVHLHGKLAKAGYEVSRNWPLVVGEMFEQLCRRDEALAPTLVGEKDFGRPEHSLWAMRMTGETRLAAARKILEKTLAAGDDAKWTAELVELAGLLSLEETRKTLAELAVEQPGLRDAVVVVLAKSPQPSDRGLLVSALNSPQAEIIAAAAGALAKLGGKADANDIATVLQTLRSYTAAKPHANVRKSLSTLLQTWTEQTIHVDETRGDLRTAYRPWYEWFAKAHPAAAKTLDAAPVDATNWPERLAKIDWSAGDATRGRKVFEARTCHRCHGQASRLGPDLNGVAQRFSRPDLFTAIVDPNREVAPAYQTTQVTTKSGQTHVGLLVYESPESTLVQTGPDTTLRITDEDLKNRRPSRQSLMPTALLNQATDADLADLYQYLTTLGKK